MPEGHSIHRLAATFDELFSGAVLSVSSPQGRFTDGAALLDGHSYRGSEAYGKHLIQYLGDLALHTHLGLYGSWVFDGDQTFIAPHAIGAPRRKIGEREVLANDLAEPGIWQPPEPRGQVRVRLATDHGVADLTGPNQCCVLARSEVEDISLRLGPDPLRSDADGTEFVLRARRSGRRIGELVMDQSIIAGPGNIYRAEVLFLAGIDPYRPGNQVSEAGLWRLWRLFVTQMRRGVKSGQISLTPQSWPERYYVYQRVGKPCLECGSEIVCEQLSGRKLYRCPGCQS